MKTRSCTLWEIWFENASTREVLIVADTMDEALASVKSLNYEITAVWKKGAVNVIERVTTSCPDSN